ncbi:MAG: NAD-dependent epimerase/dehydratase family protein, partial [Pseudomonadota bacterium]
MNILILGGGGMIGRKLAASLNDSASLTLVDVAFPPDFELDCERISGDLGDQTLIKQLAARRFDAIVHLAAVVSGEAERDFAKGWSVNTLSLFALLDAL